MLLTLVVFLDVKDKTKNDQLSLFLLTFSPVFTFSHLFSVSSSVSVFTGQSGYSMCSLTFFVSIYQLTGLLYLHMMESPLQLSLRE